MTTRTLTPADPHASRSRGSVLPWSFLVAFVLSPVLVIGGAVYADEYVPHEEEGVYWLVPLIGVALFLYAIFGAPVYKWGPSGLLFTLGLLVITAGFAGAVGTRVVEEATITLHEGDEDQDNRVDEDDVGDADDSENNPTRIDGLCELREPDDDDSDCKVDEDPAPLYETRSEVRTALRVSRELSIGAVILGVLLVGTFALVQNTSHRAAGPTPPVEDAADVTRRDGGAR